MKVEVKRFNFAKGTVTTYEREVSDTPPATPLTNFLIARAAKKALRQGTRAK